MNTIKHLSIILITVLLCLTAQAQLKTNKATVKWGPEIDASKRSSLSDIVAVDDEFYYALRWEKTDLNIEKYNFKCEQIVSRELNIEAGNSKLREYQGIRDFGLEPMHLFSSFYNKKDEKNYLFKQTLNRKTLAPNDDAEMIAEMDLSESKGKRFSDFSILTADDSSHVMVYFNKPEQKEGFQKLEMQVYTNTMKMLWKRDVELPYEDELFDVTQRRIDHNGNVYILGKLYKDKVKSRVKGAPNYTWRLICFDESGEKFNQEIKMDEYFMPDITFRIAKNNDVICVGFYSTQGKSDIDGVFYLNIDPITNQVKKSSLKEFELDFVMETLTDKQSKKMAKRVDKGADTQLMSYDLDRLILREDGSATIIGEQYVFRVTTRTVSNPNGGMSTTTTYHYHYNNILVININSSGEISWATQIPKRQHSTNDGGYYSSYASAIVGDQIYFVFNDNVENLFIKEGQKIKNYTFGKKSMVILVHLDENGEWTKEGLFSKLEADVITIPKVCEQIKADEMVIFGKWKKDQKFATVKFK